MVTARSTEAEAFLTSVEAAAPDAVSACAGWTTREVAAHVLGNAIEVVRHLEPYLQGDPVPQTRSFEEREAPLRAAGHRTVLNRLAQEDERMRTVVAEVLAREPDAVIPWTGRQMAVAKFLPHLRNEYALHRWDVAGDDDVGASVLGSPDLVEHSVGELGGILLVAGRRHDPAPTEDLRLVLRAAGQRDLRVDVEGDFARLVWVDGESSGAAVDMDAAARHLFIWGRRPDGRGRVRSGASQSELARVQTLLGGY